MNYTVILAATAAALLAGGCASPEPGITDMLVGDRCVVGTCDGLEQHAAKTTGFNLAWLPSPHVTGRPGYITRSTPSTMTAEQAHALVGW